jgi:hypothetical protein
MNRIALAQRLDGLSKVFANHTPYSRDLAAMSYVLNKMPDEKFKSILSGTFSSDEDVEGCMCGKSPMGPEALPFAKPDEEGGVKKIVLIQDNPMSLEASSNGMFWSKEASEAVLSNLVRDVVGMDKSICCDTGRKLDKEQIPDGTHAGIPERPSTLKAEQTPNVAPVIESKMVEKSHGAVQKKEAAKKTAGIEDIEEQKAEDQGDKADVETEKAKELTEKANKALEKAKEHDEKSKEHAEIAEEKEEKEEDSDDSTSDKDAFSYENLILDASMDEPELSSAEISELSKLF